MILCFVCLRPVAFVPNVASISGLSFLDCSVDFLYRLFSSCLHMLCNVLNQFWVADSGTTLNGGRRFQVIIRKTCQWPIVGECHVSCPLQSSVEFVSFHDFSYGLWDCSENVVFFYILQQSTYIVAATIG